MIKYKNGEDHTKEQLKRDINATAPARAATIMYSEEYEDFDKGIMSFWDQLDNWKKSCARAEAELILKSPLEE
jgi:hypothetical protein